jgi:hypothetical protein
MLSRQISSTDRRRSSSSAAPTFLTRRGIAQRYGVSIRTAARIVISDGFPDPVEINGRPLWRVDHVEAYEATHVRVRAAS